MIPDPLVEYDMSGFNEVVVEESNGDVSIFDRHHFCLLHFRYNNVEIKCKLDYSVLEPGNYIYLNKGAIELHCHVGKLVAILHSHDGNRLIAYTRPQHAAMNNYNCFFAHEYTVGIRDDQVLHLVPLDRFLQRAYVYAVNDENFNVVL